MNPFELTAIKGTNIQLPKLGLGGVGLGGLLEEVSDEQGLELLARAYELGIRYIDTAPRYGAGKSERLIGQFLRECDGEPPVISTKVGRILIPREGDGPVPGEPFVNADPFEPVFDYSRDGILRSLENSLKLLGRDSVEILFLHDPEFGPQEQIGEGIATLRELKEQGATQAIGAGVNRVEMAMRLLNEGDLDIILLANCYSLMVQDSLDDFFPACLERGTPVIPASLFHSGMLLRKDLEEKMLGRRHVPPEAIERLRQHREVAREFDLPLNAPAMQIAAAHPAATTILVGANSAQHVEENVRGMQMDIPSEYWVELKSRGLIREDTPTPSQD